MLPYVIRTCMVMSDIRQFWVAKTEIENQLVASQLHEFCFWTVMMCWYTVFTVNSC